MYNKSLKYTCQRQSNNADPEFTDAEVMTVYLYAVSEEHLLKIKHIHSFAKDRLLSWFPLLPPYQKFNARLNFLASAWQALVAQLLSATVPDGCDFENSIVDSFPVVTCKGRNRTGKMAREIADKGFCSTKNMYYYGLKLHLLGYRRKGTLPFPEMLALSAASENNFKVFQREFNRYICNKTVFADKIYNNSEFFVEKEKSQNYRILTPVKLVKGEAEVIRQREKAANDLFSCAVSSVRQPIEALFNWLNEKTALQQACKVRSTAGLLVHVFAKIAAAFIGFVFNPLIRIK
jgi:hypothetical protein